MSERARRTGTPPLDAPASPAGVPDTARASAAGRTPAVDVLVVGGGLGGLVTAFWLTRLAPGTRVAVLEAGSVGGKASTVDVGGFEVDTGPGTLTLEPAAGAPLLEALGFEDEVAEPATDASRRYLVRRGRLVAVPSHPVGLLRSPLLSWPAKARALAEPLVPPTAGDESVHDFLARRFGGEVARRLGEALVSGVAAGDPRALSVAAAFPQLKGLEARAGSVLRGMAAARKAGAPRRRVVTLHGGMRTLHEALAAALGGRVAVGCEAVALRRQGPGYEVSCADGRAWLTREVVLAAPAPAAARLLAGVAPAAASRLAGIAYAPVDVVALGFREADVPPLVGFGFLAPRGEGVRSLGVIYTSAVAPGSAPVGHVLVRAIAGGALDPGFSEMTEAEKVAAVRADLATTLGVAAEPVMTHVVSWPRGIPQYRVGHRDLVADVERDLAGAPGVRLVGDAYRGLGVADRLREGLMVARELAAGPA